MLLNSFILFSIYVLSAVKKMHISKQTNNNNSRSSNTIIKIVSLSLYELLIAANFEYFCNFDSDGFSMCL